MGGAFALLSAPYSCPLLTGENSEQKRDLSDVSELVRGGGETKMPPSVITGEQATAQGRGPVCSGLQGRALVGHERSLCDLGSGNNNEVSIRQQEPRVQDIRRPLEQPHRHKDRELPRSLRGLVGARA